METLIVIVLGLVLVAGSTAIAPKIKVAAPLILVVVGIAVSFLPFVPVIEIEPELILAGILPPLLYSASVSMPSMDFRRELRAIGGLSVVLVVLSSVVLGFFFSLVIPGLGIWWGIALGAVVSPTDAVATSIVKRSGVSGRVVAVLEGESLLNDATALVLLRSAIVATAASISFGSVLGSFAYAVAVAAVFGIVVGKLNLFVRARVKDSTVNTVLSFTVPFLASIPAELLGASGLVAAVVAGLITGHGAARALPPRHRVSDAQNWRAVELVLEGTIFLIMGLELAGIVAKVQGSDNGLLTAALIALGALVLTIVVRTAYVTPLVYALRRRAARSELMKPRFATIQDVLDNPEAHRDKKRRGPALTPQNIERGRTRLRRAVADIDYLLAEPLGWRDGAVIVWSGMRGAVTLAAAQTLPEGAPNRSLLVLIAFLVAGGSLLLQGGTLARVVRWIRPASEDVVSTGEREKILALLSAAMQTVPAVADGNDRDERKRHALAGIHAMRSALLDARDDGIYSAGALDSALATLDADEISIEMKGRPSEP